MVVKTILSIDGGGMKGYIPCAVLATVEARAKKTVPELFDMVAGTSIGGILACIFATGKTATDALQFFTVDGPNIFGNEQPFGHAGVIKPRYAAQPIESALFARLGNVTLSQAQMPLLVPAFDLVAYEPYFFKSPNKDVDYPLWQVARATSAAQTYFPGYKLDDKVLWDGGNVANNPTLCAMAEATRMWPDQQLRVLSLGCGASKSRFTATELIDAGIAKVGIETMGLLFDENDRLPDYILRHLMPDGYFRIDPKLSALSIDGADEKALIDLRNVANQTIVDNAAMIDAFLEFI